MMMVTMMTVMQDGDALVECCDSVVMQMVVK